MYGPDATQIMFGTNAVHVPCWMYVQNQGDGVVSFVGSSRTDGPHPLRYGSDRAHQFIVGEVILRPHLVVATDALRGEGLSSLATAAHDLDAMRSNGETILAIRQSR